jgi:hypothetical protein
MKNQQVGDQVIVFNDLQLLGAHVLLDQINSEVGKPQARVTQEQDCSASSNSWMLFARD